MEAASRGRQSSFFGDPFSATTLGVSRSSRRSRTAMAAAVSLDEGRANRDRWHWKEVDLIPWLRKWCDTNLDELVLLEDSDLKFRTRNTYKDNDGECLLHARKGKVFATCESLRRPPALLRRPVHRQRRPRRQVVRAAAFGRPRRRRGSGKGEHPRVCEPRPRGLGRSHGRRRRFASARRLGVRPRRQRHAGARHGRSRKGRGG
jgi:hypothetical protein